MEVKQALRYSKKLMNIKPVDGLYCVYDPTYNDAAILRKDRRFYPYTVENGSAMNMRKRYMLTEAAYNEFRGILDELKVGSKAANESMKKFIREIDADADI